jgi:hypothetical protein
MSVSAEISPNDALHHGHFLTRQDEVDSSRLVRVVCPFMDGSSLDTNISGLHVDANSVI